MKSNYDGCRGWVVKKAAWNNYMDMFSFKRTRKESIASFVTADRRTWRQLKACGWSCVKVKLVEVEAPPKPGHRAGKEMRYG